MDDFGNFIMNYFSSECDEGKFGDQCLQTCKCNVNTTTFCNKTDGSCVCKDGWTSSNCSVDVDECQGSDLICPTHSVCRNFGGSFECVCDTGFTWNQTTRSCNGIKYLSKSCICKCNF